VIVVAGCRDALAAKGIDLGLRKGGGVKVQTALSAFLLAMTGWSYRFAEDDLTIMGIASLTASQQTQLATWGAPVTVAPDPQ
jgi:hypothetical protein